jgi:hypothetical protein
MGLDPATGIKTEVKAAASAMFPRHEQTFPALTAPEIARMRRFGGLRHYSEGEKLFETGKPGPGMFVILSGHVAIRVATNHGQNGGTVVWDLNGMRQHLAFSRPRGGKQQLRHLGRCHTIAENIPQRSLAPVTSHWACAKVGARNGGRSRVSVNSYSPSRIVAFGAGSKRGGAS